MAFDESRKNVLILEDTDKFLRNLEVDLRKLCYVPYSTTSMQAFIQIYQEKPAYAVILDNYAPRNIGGAIEKDIGINLAQDFLRREPGIKVALHTSTERTADIVRLEKVGLIYLFKPVSIDNLAFFLGNNSSL